MLMVVWLCYEKHIYKDIYVLFCVTRYGFGWKKFSVEANKGTGLKVANWMRGYMTYVLPVLIVVIFILGIFNYFK